MTSRRVALRLALLSAWAGGGCATPAPATRAEAPPVLRLVDPPPTIEAFSDPARRARLAATFPELASYLANQAAALHLPSLAFGVVIDGELAFERGFGPRAAGGADTVDADTVYRIGSITKTFTALAILALRDEGKLSLDAPAARYLPELAGVQYPTRDAPAITLRHLLTHSSGLPRLGPFNYAQADHDVSEAEVLRGLPSVVLQSAPGTQTRYSNLGFGLLGLVVSRVSGQRYRDYVDAKILAPLGMTSTRWSERDVPVGRLATAYQRGPSGPQPVAHWRLGASEAAGGLYTSLRDLARYVAFQLSAYPPRSDDDRGPLRRSSLREAHLAQRPGELTITRREAAGGAPSLDASAGGVGLAWFEHQTCAYEQVVDHAGGTDGYAAKVRMLPQRGVGLIALSNLAEADLDGLTDGALAVLARSGALAARVIMPGAALTRAVSGAAALYDDFQPAAYAELFTPKFREAVPPAAVVALIRELTADHGACDARAVRALAVDSPTAGTFSVPCARGSLEYRIGVTAEGKIERANVRSSAAADAAADDRCTPR